jgi:flagella basal body P-ring formation protein FlgA
VGRDSEYQVNVVQKTFRKTEWTLPVALFALAAMVHTTSPASALDTASSGANSVEDTQDATATAQSPAQTPQALLLGQLAQNIANQYPGAKITVNPSVHWTHGGFGESFQSVAVLGETPRGEIMFSVTAADGTRAGEGWASYSAWVPARVATKRLHPGDRLADDMFTLQDVNVAFGQAHELRGVILEPEAQVANLEARQSVLEGQMLLSTQVQRVPDVRRGDAVTVQLVSNGLSLQTQGVAEEPAYTGGQVRVTASKTKRELVGRLSPSGVVEVKL